MFDFLTVGGLIFLIFGWGFVLTLTITSLAKIVKIGKKN